MATILHNARVFEPPDRPARDDHPNFADCIVFDSSSGVITHVGSVKDAAAQEAFASAPGCTSHDLHGQVILPGLIDSHMHLLLTGEALGKLHLGACRTVAQVRDSIREFARTNPEAPRVLCRGWMPSMMAAAPEGAAAGLASQLDDLDARPIYVDAEDLHSTWCSRAALDELGVDAMPDPPGGTIHRGADGRASGLLAEAAAVGIVWPFLAKASSRERNLQLVDDAFAAYAAAGYTGVVEMATDEPLWELLHDYRSRQQHGELPIWLAAHWLILPTGSDADNLRQVDRAIELHRTAAPDCRVAGIKIMVDGVVDSCTAALREPYAHDGSNADPVWAADALYAVLRHASDAGLQCALHAIGDAAIGLAIDTLERVGHPQRRHRIEHLEVCSATDAARLGRLGITASVQPVHSDPAVGAEFARLLGPERCRHVFPYAAMTRHGAVLAFGTDAPTAPHEPLPNLYIATTRQSALEPNLETRTAPEFAVGLVEAVAAATRGAAYSCFADGRVGSLKPGLQANLTVIDMAWDATKLLSAHVTQTWYKGKRIYAKERDPGR